MRVLSYVLLLIVVFTPGRVLAADYYYCDCQAGADVACVAGDDTRSGTDPNLPRRSFAHARSIFAGLDAGDAIRFCRGGSFVAGTQTRWVNTQCRGTLPCAVGAYQPPAQSAELPRPVISQPNNDTLFSLADTGNADHEEGYTFSDLDLRCPGCLASGTGWAFFLYNDVDDVSIENVDMDNFRIGVHLGGANLPANAGSDGVLDRITLRNLRITNAKAQGILGGSHGLLIENSYLQNNGGGTFFDHNIYISKGSDIVIRGNELYQSSMDANADCHGTSLVVHGIIDTMLIEGNLVREDVGATTPFCWGIAVVPGYASAENFAKVSIRGNKIVNVGNEGIALSACSDCVIENNVVVHQQPFGIVAINASDVEKNPEDAALARAAVRNNSVFIPADSDSIGIRLGAEGRGHVLVSNAVYYTGMGNFSCLDADLAAADYAAIDNNICFFPNATAQSDWERGSGSAPDPLSAWQMVSGLGMRSLYADPGYRNPDLPAVDLSPASGMVSVVDNGHPELSSATDYRGKTRGRLADVGAYEFGVFNPPAPPVLYIQ